MKTEQIAAQSQAAGNIGPEPKIARVLRALLRLPHLNRFEAERDPAISDHVLPSSISELKRYGVRVDSRLVKIPGHHGQVALVAEYSIPVEAHAQGLRVLDKILDRRPGRRRV